MFNIAVLIALALAFLLFARRADAYTKAGTWTIGIYMCGSDLESELGAASDDIEEILDAKLDRNVNVIIQTGGARRWRLDSIDPEKSQRWQVTDKGYRLLSSDPQVNMGSTRTLSDFVSFLRREHRADHNVLIIWGHGNGSVGGVAVDENYCDDKLIANMTEDELKSKSNRKKGYDSLTLKELRAALDSALGVSEAYLPCDTGEPYFEIIGFDSCLMASIDTAAALYGHTKYMLASQNVEPGCGWQYTYWLNMLSANTRVSGADLGRMICCSYIAGCRDEDMDTDSTLSLLDMRYFSLVRAAYNCLGYEALKLAMNDRGCHAAYWRRADKSLNYGNSNFEGYSNMIDMLSFAQKLSDMHPDEVMLFEKALGTAVICRVSGRDFHDAGGLSCYFPMDKKKKTYRAFSKLARLNIFDLFIGDILNAASRQRGADGSADGESFLKSTDPGNEELCGSIVQETREAIAYWANPQSPGRPPLSAETESHLALAASRLDIPLKMSESAPFSDPYSIRRLAGTPIRWSEEGEFAVIIPPEKLGGVFSVSFRLSLYGYEESIRSRVAMNLGSNVDLKDDWNNGIFACGFKNGWAAVDGNILPLELTDADEEINRYEAVILLNDKPVVIYVIYDSEAKEYIVRGTRRIRDDGCPDMKLRKLKPGDRITPLFDACAISDDGQETPLDPICGNTFSLGKKWKVEDAYVGDGTFMLQYEITGIDGGDVISVQSAPLFIKMQGGKMEVMQ